MSWFHVISTLYLHWPSAISSFYQRYRHVSISDSTITRSLFSVPNHHLIATLTFVIDAAVESNIYIPQLIPLTICPIADLALIYDAELISLLLALAKVLSSFPAVFVLSDSLSVKIALNDRCDDSRSILLSLISPHIKGIKIFWLPGHCRIVDNEIADALVKAVLSLPSFRSISSLPRFLMNRYKQKILFDAYKQTTSSYAELDQLTFQWFPYRSPYRAIRSSSLNSDATFVH